MGRVGWDEFPHDYTRVTCLEHHIRYYQTISGLDQVIGSMLADHKVRWEITAQEYSLNEICFGALLLYGN